MQRVAIVGPGGSGKTTFARQLGERTQLPVIHLDEHHWKPGWEPTPRDDGEPNKSNFSPRTNGSSTGITAGRWRLDCDVPTR